VPLVESSGLLRVEKKNVFFKQTRFFKKEQVFVIFLRKTPISHSEYFLLHHAILPI